MNRSKNFGFLLLFMAALCLSNLTIVRTSEHALNFDEVEAKYLEAQNTEISRQQRSKWLEETLKDTLEALSLKLGQPFDDILNSFQSKFEPQRSAERVTATSTKSSGSLAFNSSPQSTEFNLIFSIIEYLILKFIFKNNFYLHFYDVASFRSIGLPKLR